eukprot:TRINITY_DN23369_c0_g1_i2.p1 TRINITY_DN23369_c0_g1~~TRINITY_DN23369_c0_g1_i2.p1  ORF type:complete len:192 (+),score=57.38 TRINITY_DN23369_c0_g1_i2:199-774(+)
MAQAAKMALQAYQVREPFMIREVFTACFRLSEGVCPEAFNLLAIKTSANLEEALALYSKAEALCPQLCDNFDQLIRNGDVWSTAPHLHSYLRALLGSANTLRKMGRYEEALSKYHMLRTVEEMVIVDQYLPNYRYHLPEIMIRLGDWDGAERHILVECRKHHSKLFAEDSATLVPLVWTCLLYTSPSPRDS